MRVIAGDVGGTKTLLQCVEVTAAGRSVCAEKRFESRAYESFDDLLREFVDPLGAPIDAACFAIAGPVTGDHADTTNLRWTIEANQVEQKFSISNVSLINDFHAVALAVPLLTAADLFTIAAAPRIERAPIAILGAGTGLGAATLLFAGDRWQVVESEGGHADFAPQDEEQTRLFLFLREIFGHVSWERVLSGAGLVHIYNFLVGKELQYSGEIPAKLARLADEGDAAAVHTFEIFVDLYGSEAGNAALRTLARGGVFLAGGIAGKNRQRFVDGRFLEAFRRKGRFHDLLATIPVDIIVNSNAGVIGAVEKAIRGLKM